MREKIELELEGLRRSGLSSVEISAQLNDALVELLLQKIKKRKVSKKKQIEELRKILFEGRRDS
ncbi:MAG: hypothetical protein QXR09_00685 [Candidatus Aenigmatarchaeota archaeon]